MGDRHSWEIVNCNFEKVFIFSSSMTVVFAFGGAAGTYTILSLNFVTQTSIADNLSYQ